MHPDDEATMAAMTTEFAAGATRRVLRMPGHDGGWVPVHVTVNRVEIDHDTFAGLVSLRLPTPAELDAADLSDLTRPGRRGRPPARYPIGRPPGRPRR